MSHQETIAFLLNAIATGDTTKFVAWTNTITHTLRFGGDDEIARLGEAARSYLAAACEEADE